MSFKQFNATDDVATIESAVNEVVTVTGSIITTDANTKFYQNIGSSSTDPDLGGYFQTVYDSSPTSSLSSAIFDVTYGYSASSSYYVQGSNSASLSQKVKIYRQFAGVLLGSKDSYFSINSTDRKEAIFISVRRDMFKDELKKGGISLVLNHGSTQYTASDPSAPTNFKQSVGGDYAPLKWNGTGSEVGQVWYNAGVIVLHPDSAWGAVTTWSGTKSLVNSQYSGSINNLVDGFRRKTESVQFHNQTNIVSSLYFCRAGNNEFNYSSNPTFIDDSKRIRPTSGSNNSLTRTYITTIGLYDAQDNLLAVAKTNKPITKSPESEVVFRVRLDF
jgi:hypothetical protein